MIATLSTVRSSAYVKAIAARDPAARVATAACPLFVPLAEEGWTDNEVAKATIALYLGSLQKSGIDTLILGCTHYPLLKAAIGEYLGEGVKLVDSAEETAREVRETLKGDGTLRRRGRGAASFFVTDVPDRFIKVGRRFLGERVESAVRIER